MRAAPPVRISLRRFGIWRAAVTLTAGVGSASVGGWVVVRPEPVGAVLTASLVVVGLTILWLALRLLHVEPAELRWDGRAWHLGPTLDRTTPGEIEVAIDLGAWLLLRFTAAGSVGPTWRRPVRWLPVQRRGLGTSWHALRCALYSPHAPPPGVASPPPTMPGRMGR